MDCFKCGKTEIRCVKCGELIIPGQEYICDDFGRIIEFGHRHLDWCCGKNGITKKEYDFQEEQQTQE